VARLWLLLALTYQDQPRKSISDRWIDGPQVKDIAPQVVVLVPKWDLHKKQREKKRINNNDENISSNQGKHNQ
jgi:hypothetical protein